jgi:hypothetical protein
MKSPIENRVAKSGLITIDLEALFTSEETVLLDIKPWLYEELVLREKDFRAQVKTHDWTKYQDKHVAITCTADAVVPLWAYMLISSVLTPFAKTIIFGNLNDLQVAVWRKKIDQLNIADFAGKRVVIKGCSTINIPNDTYVFLTQKLVPVVQSLMFGEPCSTVPIYKKKKEK